MAGNYLKKKRVQAFTLLEIIISLTLTTFLMGVLFQFYRQNAVMSVQLEKAKQTILSYDIFQMRMLPIFNELMFESDVSKEIPLSTCSDSKANGLLLNIFYDNGVDPEPGYCDRIQGQLYVDHKKKLCLTQQAHDGKTRTDIFFEGVRDLNFSFFDAKEKLWTGSWMKEKEYLPDMVKISLVFESQKNKPREFVYFLPQTHNPIIYKKS